MSYMKPIEWTIGSLKNEKAVGIDTVTIDMIKTSLLRFCLTGVLDKSF